jgi:hypothetical protein
LSNITTAEVIARSVAIAIKVPAFARVLAEEPLFEMTKELMKVPDKRNTRPREENFLAAVVEKYVTKRMIAIGLTHHHGSDPGPPGFAKKAKLGPPPGRFNPISAMSWLGLRKTPNDEGAERRSGSAIKVVRRFSRSINNGFL